MPAPKNDDFALSAGYLSRSVPPTTMRAAAGRIASAVLSMHYLPSGLEHRGR